MKIKIYNEEGTLIAINIEQALELLELNGYKVIKESKEKNDRPNKMGNTPSAIRK